MLQHREAAGSTPLWLCGVRRIRADDTPLLESLHSETVLGTLLSRAARGRLKPQIEWKIVAKADCLRLIELLDAFPLRGRKSLDYAIWRAAAHWWIAGNPALRPAGRNWEPMRLLKGRLHAAKRYDPNGCVPVIDRSSGLGDDWGPFLSGFITAEGSLGVFRNGRRLVPTLTIRLRMDDYELLQQFRARTFVGRLYSERGSDRQSPVAMWLVKRSDDLRLIVDQLDQHPLRGRRAREYAIWREAAMLYASNQPRRLVQARLPRHRVQLAEARRYRVPGELS